MGTDVQTTIDDVNSQKTKITVRGINTKGSHPPV